MKKLEHICIFFLIIVVALFTAISCNNNNPNVPVEKFKVSFLNTDGSIIKTVEVEKGKTTTPPSLPEKEGYELFGWSLKDSTKLYDFSMSITSNLTLYPVWKIKRVIVSFYGGGGVTPIPNQILDYGSKAVKPADPTKEDDSFKGWYLPDSEESFDFDTPIKNNITIYAKWALAKDITVSFYDGNELIIRKTYTEQSINSFPEIESLGEGFALSGWFMEGSSDVITDSTFSLPYSETEYKFKANITTNLLTIDTKGDVYGTNLLKNSTAITSLVIPNSIDGIPVTSIGDNAFSGYSNLTRITIPDSVTSIGDYAFSGCSNLTSITIPNSVTSIGDAAFQYCSSLSGIIIPDSVTSIGDYAFQYCSSLNSITISNSITSMGDYAFRGCSSLSGITIPNSVTSIGAYAFDGCARLTSTNIPDGVTSIGKRAFYGCSSLNSITIPNSVTSIGAYAFYDCSSLNSVTIGNGVTPIGDFAFYGCSSLNSITIPDSVTSIGDYAFYDCSSLNSVTIVNGGTSIGDYAFFGCSNLTDIYAESFTKEKWRTLSMNAFIPLTATIHLKNELKDGKIEDGGITYCVDSTGKRYVYNADTSITTAEIQNIVGSDSVTYIGRWAFDGCSSLNSITIPDSVTSIGDYAFRDCSNLTSITIPDSVTSIGAWAFDGCSSLTSINIPNSVTSIGEYAFSGCSSLTTINIKQSQENTLLTGAPWGATSATVNWNYTE